MSYHSKPRRASKGEAVLMDEIKELKRQLALAGEMYASLADAWSELMGEHFALVAKRLPRTRMDAVSADTMIAIENVVKAQLISELAGSIHADKATHNALGTLVKQARDAYFSSIKPHSDSAKAPHRQR